MDAIKSAVPTTPTSRPQNGQPAPPQGPSAPVDSYAGSVTNTDPGIYKPQPKIISSVSSKPDGGVDTTSGKTLPTGANGGVATEAKTTATSTSSAGVTVRSSASGTLHPTGKQDGAVSAEVRHDEKKDGVTSYQGASATVSATSTPGSGSTFNATATGRAGVQVKKGDNAAGVSIGASAASSSKGVGASVGTSVTGQTRLGPIYLRGEAGVGASALDGNAAKPNIFGKIQVGNPKLPFSVTGQCSIDPTGGSPACTGGLGGRF